MKVLKFGGTSVQSPENIWKVKAIVEADAKNRVVVVSAFSGVTDILLQMAKMAYQGSVEYKQLFAEIEQRHILAAKELVQPIHQGHVLSEVKVQLNELEDYLQSIQRINELTPKLNDYILSFGERLSSYILSQVINGATWVDARNLIVTDHRFGNARVNFEETNRRCEDFFKTFQGVAILPGFIASDSEGNTTTLGRGGSDYSAAILAAALNATDLQIWTDVDGFMTADPRKVKKAYPIPHLTYQEAFELCHFGAKVIYTPTIYPVLHKNIPILVKNTFNPEHEGTRIDAYLDTDRAIGAIKGISSIDDIALATLQGVGMAGIAGISRRLFGSLAMADVNIILISQASSEQSITFAIAPGDVDKAREAIKNEFSHEMAKQVIGLKVEEDLSILAIVGAHMQNEPGIAAKLFLAMGRNGINIKAIAQGSSELNISTVVSKKHLKKALNVIHDSFFLSGYQEVHLYLIGVGTVGSSLLDQIQRQQAELLEKHHLKVNLIGIANSKKMCFDEDGLDLKGAMARLANSSEVLNLKTFVERIAQINLRNSILVDCTASADVAAVYEKALSSFISVVTANKIACSGPYEHYANLIQIAKTKNVKFLYETNVCAGLPVIKTINDLILSGDKITKLEAVLSGTLNFIFNTISEEIPLSQTIRLAKEKGYSEPDPRIDLSGLDVMRKLLILARESGTALDQKQVKIKTFLPDSIMQTSSLAEFWSNINTIDAEFESARKTMEAKGLKWRFVAKLEGEDASIELQEVGLDHPFFHLQGSDNIVTLYTERYSAQPMVIKGAGAGAAVTASGVFADIIRISNI